MLLQDWSCFRPNFDGVAFVSYYIELPIMLLLYVGWKLLERSSILLLSNMDLETDVYEIQPSEVNNELGQGWRGIVQTNICWLF
jgi:amino acid transporter, AAT family